MSQTQISTQGSYVGKPKEVNLQYSNGTVFTADAQIFSGEGYLHGIQMSVVSTGVGNGTLSLHNGTTTAASQLFYAANDATLEGLGSKVIPFSAPLRFSSGMYADVTNAKVNLQYRK